MPRITPVSRSQRPSRPTHQQPPQLTMPLTSGRARPTSTSQRDHCTSCQLTASTTVAVPLASRPGCALGCRPLQGRQLASTGPCEAALSFALQATTRRGCSRSQARATALCLAATLLGCSPEHKPAAQHKPAQPSTSPPSLVQAQPASHKPIQPSTSPPSLASRLAGYAPPHRSAVHRRRRRRGGGGCARPVAVVRHGWELQLAALRRAALRPGELLTIPAPALAPGFPQRGALLLGIPRLGTLARATARVWTSAAADAARARLRSACVGAADV
jgi:hypothetical protein